MPFRIKQERYNVQIIINLEIESAIVNEDSIANVNGFLVDRIEVNVKEQYILWNKLVQLFLKSEEFDTWLYYFCTANVASLRLSGNIYWKVINDIYPSFCCQESCNYLNDLNQTPVVQLEIYYSIVIRPKSTSVFFFW